MNKKPPKTPPLEEGLMMAMRALDNQIARAMERSPSEREVSGVQKWEPVAERVERVCVWVMNSLGDKEVQLDSLLVLSQAMTKALALIVDDLGEEGLGKMRSAYCVDALEKISVDAVRAKSSLRGGAELM